VLKSQAYLRNRRCDYCPEYIWPRISRCYAYAWELHITSFCAPQRMDAEIADATQIGGSVHAGCRPAPITLRRRLLSRACERIDAPMFVKAFFSPFWESAGSWFC
jgi:hypothetical protein